MISPVKVWRHQKKITDLLGKEAKIISWTVIKVPPLGFEEVTPYPVALVELENKERFVAQLVNWQEKDLRVGQKVKAVYRRMHKPDSEGVIPYGIKFTPV